MATLAPYAFHQFFDNSGEVLAAGKIYTYYAGTDTLRDTYSEDTGSILNTNPIILDSAGRADIWLEQGAYKFVLTDSDDTTVKEVDNIVSSTTGTFGDVDTYSNLRALTSGQYSVVVVHGYSAVGDGLGGIFFWDESSSATDNDSTVIQPNSAPSVGRWLKFLIQGQDISTLNITCTGYVDASSQFKVNGTKVIGARGSALTAQLTTITHTAASSADYAIQDLTNSSGFGFVTKDEGNTVLAVIANLQTRVAQLEARLGSSSGHGLFT